MSTAAEWFGSPVVNLEPVEQFVNVEPTTNEISVSLVAAHLVVLPVDLEYQHRAELDEVDLPPSPLDRSTQSAWVPVWRPDWAAVAYWLSGALQLALGVVIGSAVVWALLWYVAWLLR